MNEKQRSSKINHMQVWLPNYEWNELLNITSDLEAENTKLRKEIKELKKELQKLKEKLSD